MLTTFNKAKAFGTSHMGKMTIIETLQPDMYDGNDDDSEMSIELTQDEILILN